MFDRWIDKMGITDGRLTRAQFNTYMEQRMAERGQAPPTGAAPGHDAAAPGGNGKGGPGGFRGNGTGGSNEDMLDRWAESMFRKLDANGDGFLNYDEMTDNLRAERDKWDMNKDGVIDLNEFKAYFRAAMAQRMSEAAGFGMNNAPPAAAPEHHDEDEPKPVVYRAGKLPKELPAWFKQIDTDGDGQISLLEWRSAGKSMDEFQKYDRNGDGFITIAEVMYVVQGKNYVNGVAINTSPTDPRADTTRTADSGRSRFGGGGFPGSADGKGGDSAKSFAPSADGKSATKGGLPSPTDGGKTKGGFSRGGFGSR
jgi:Ca2+-binding EF-hand superfamily protein